MIWNTTDVANAERNFGFLSKRMILLNEPIVCIELSMAWSSLKIYVRFVASIALPRES